MVAYADLVLPDTTYLERHDCISLLDRPISEPDAAADAIRWPVVAPERPATKACAASSRCCSTSAPACGSPAWPSPTAAPTYRDYADYMTRHQRRPGVGPLAGWRGDGDGRGPRRAQPRPDRPLHRERRLLDRPTCPEEAAYFKPWNAAYQDWAVATGFYDSPQPYLFQLYCRAAGEAPGRRPRQGRPQQPPDALARPPRPRHGAAAGLVSAARR